MWFILILISAFSKASVADFADSITFYGLNADGVSFISSSEPGSTAEWCDVNGKFAIVVHAWLENCNDYNIAQIVTNLARVRGGCVLCMDYGYYSLTLNYLGLLGNYNGIQTVLVNKLLQLQNEGFAPINGYMFGFSYGSHLAINSAIRAFGNRNFGMIDACEPAGPGFDGTSLAAKNASLAAKNVQCINTSTSLGTTTRTCTQNWLMGSCGVSQPAGGFFRNSHQLCTNFYNSAFTNNFRAISRPRACTKTSRSLTTWPAGYRMGYDDSRLTPNAQPVGTLYACTSSYYPYNC